MTAPGEDPDQPKLDDGVRTRPLRLRIVVIGSEASGKSCVIKRYCEKRFVSKYSATIGIDYGATKILIDQREVSIHIFDTSGSDLFRDVRNEFYCDMHGILLVCDVTNRDSFDSLNTWTDEVMTELRKEDRDMQGTVLMLCCNKCDLQNRQVDEVEVRLWSEMRGYPLFETSALTGAGINEMFQSFFSQIVKNIDQGQSDLTQTPVSARKVRVVKVEATPIKTPGGQPSTEQSSVMARIRSGHPDPWRQMGLTPGCGKDEVNKAYKKLALLLHPDKTGVQGADEAFKALGVARKTILRTLGVT